MKKKKKKINILIFAKITFSQLCHYSTRIIKSYTSVPKRNLAYT